MVVTGASAGVGRAIVRAFAHDGYDVGLIARGAAGLAGAARDVRADGGRAVELAVDVADWTAMRNAAHRVESELGPVAVWVNNAMTTVFSPVSELEAEEIKRVTEVTYLGQVHGALAALELMRPRDRGLIISVGSALAFRAIPLQAAYCGAKFATRGFLEALRTELLHTKSDIRICSVHLPAVDTPQFGWCRSKLDPHARPVPPIYRPEQAAEAVLAMTSAPRRQKILGVWNTLVVEGNKLAPGIFDHFAARGSWESQLMAGTTNGRKKGNLFSPLDDAEGRDQGTRGRFGDRAGGMADPSFLRALPQTAAIVASSVVARAREVLTAVRYDGPHRKAGDDAERTPQSHVAQA